MCCRLYAHSSFCAQMQQWFIWSKCMETGDSKELLVYSSTSAELFLTLSGLAGASSNLHVSVLDRDLCPNVNAPSCAILG